MGGRRFQLWVGCILCPLKKSIDFSSVIGSRQILYLWFLFEQSYVVNTVMLQWYFLQFCSVNSLTAIRVRAGMKKLPPHRFPTVGIVPEFRQTTTQLPPQTSSPWCSISPPPYSIDSMNRPYTMHGRPSEGVSRGRLGGVLYKLLK